MAERILAVEFTLNTVRAALADRAWHTFVLVGTFESERSPGEPDLGPALARLLAQTGTPDIVISALPGELVAQRLLTLPFRDRRRLERAVPFALEEHLPFAVDDAIVAFATVGRDNGGARVLAAMARKVDLGAHLALLSKAGLNPKTVTLSALALPALVARGRNGSAAPHLLVDLNETRGSVVLLDAEGAPCVLRTVTLASGARAATPDAEAATAKVLTVVQQTLLAYGDNGERPDLILSGQIGVIPEVRAHLAKALALTVRGPDQLDCSGLLTGFTPERLRFASCVAMLLGEMPTASAELLNFRQGEYAYHGRLSTLTPLRVPVRLAVAAAVLVLIHLGLSLANQGHRLSVAERALAVAAQPALGLHPPADVRAALSAGIAAANKRLRLIGGSGSQGSPLDSLLAVSQSIPPRLSIDLDGMEIDESGVKLSGRADSFNTIDQVKRALGSSEVFGDIQVTDAKGGTEANKVEFRLSASLKDSLAGAE